ncbi:hypothetical protein BZA77DRAFT_359871 [Pyronema omphalodes]|nr:hypothetical protein BZA77DRAFT_359871 [Pyronema omphalodes]
MSLLKQNSALSNYSPGRLQRSTSLQLQATSIDGATSNNPPPSVTIPAHNSINEAQNISLSTQLSIHTRDNDHITDTSAKSKPTAILSLKSENVNMLKTTPDYGLERWLSQKKEESGVRFYGL